MKKSLFAVAAVAALFSTPAFANEFTGVRAEVTAGANDVIGGVDLTDVTYGAGVGVDAELYKNVIVGVEASADNVFDRSNIAVSGRLGYVVTDNVMVYGKVGYASWKQFAGTELDGLRVGGGVEVALPGPFYTGAEYRYSDFEGNVGQHAAVVKVGVRF